MLFYIKGNNKKTGFKIHFGRIEEHVDHNYSLA